MMTFPNFVARGAQVWQAPLRIEQPDGTAAIQLGHVICAVENNFDDRAMVARQIAAALTLVQRLDTIDQTALAANHLIADLSAHIGRLSLPNYGALIEVLVALNQLHGWAVETRRRMAGQTEPVAPTAA